MLSKQELSSCTLKYNIIHGLRKVKMFLFGSWLNIQCYHLNIKSSVLHDNA